MKFFKYILIAAFALTFAACQEEEFAPGAKDRLDCQKLFFPQEQAKSYEVAPEDDNYLTFKVERQKANFEAEVPYEISMSEEGFFEMEDEIIYFEEDQNKAEFRVYFSDDFEIGKKYTCTIKVTDPKYVSNYTLASNELTFSLTVVKWEQVIGKNGEQTGMWRDDVFSCYTQLGAQLANPNAEKEVKIYQRADKPGYYRVDDVYTAEFITYMAEGDLSRKDLYEDHCPNESIYIDASNPDKVLIDWQYAFEDVTPYGLGSAYICSDCEECFDSGYSNLYGKYKDGSITFPKNSLILYFPYANGAIAANNSGKHRLVMPGERGYDFSLEVNFTPAKNGVMPFEFKLGSDVDEVRYQVFSGHLSDVDMVSSLETVKNGNGYEVVEESGTYDFTTSKTGLYTLIACSYDADGNFKEYTSVKFGYDTVDDPKDVDIHMGLIVSDKYGGTGNTKENSMEYYIYGSDIVDAKVAIYKEANYEDFHSSIDSLVQYYMPSLDVAQLKSLNNEGYNGVIGNLASGVRYTMIAYVDNGYHSGIFTTTASTEGAYNPLDEQFQFYDLPSELQPAAEEEYFKEWQLWSVDPYEPGNWNRTNRGTVSFAEGKDLYFNSAGEQVESINKADPSKTMQVISLSGMFPEIKEKYNMKSDAIDFHYYEGYIYSLMTQLERITIDGEYAYPTNAYLLYYNGGLTPNMENFAMLGGFVRNPVEKDNRDVIAFVSNPTANYEYLAMCLAWFESSNYASDSNGYLFEEEGHIYPMLISPDSKYVPSAEEAKAALPASCSMISKELQKGRTNHVETDHGYVMSVIDRFKNVPHNYMENILDIEVEDVVRTAEFSMTKSDKPFVPVMQQASAPQFIHRGLR